MDPDNFAKKFSEAVFNYLWYSEDMDFVSDTTITESFTTVGETEGIVLGFEDMIEFVTETAKAIFLLSVLTRPSFDKTINTYFKPQAITRIRVFTFIATYCFDNHANIEDDIFSVVLNTLAFVYRLVLHCWKEGCKEFAKFAPMCWTEIFEADLKIEFYASGGWRKFKTYITEKEYASKDGDEDQRAVAAFLEEIGLSPKMDQERPDPQPIDHDSDETTNNREDLLVVEPQSNDATAEFSFDTVSANIPGFKEESEASVEEVDKLQTNGEAAEFWYRTVASHIPEFKEKVGSLMFEFDDVRAKIVKLVEKVKM